MVWWLDDGGLIGKGRRKGRWNTQGFHKRGTAFLVEFLAKKYQIKSVVASYVYNKNKKRYYYIYIQPLPLKRLLLLIMLRMLYTKVCSLYYIRSIQVTICYL